jgi:RNA polymerase sigma-70 factor (ECF subfamily)
MLHEAMTTSPDEPPDAGLTIETHAELSESAAIVPFPVEVARVDGLDVTVHETQLLLRVRDQRDRTAYQRLFDLFAGKVQGYLRRTGLEPADAENILQDIMLAVWQKARLFDPARASARTWIFSLARNRLIDVKRAAKRENVMLERYSLETADEQVVEEDMFARAAGGKSVSLLAQLPPEQARVLLMAYVEGKSHREIALELKLPIGTVKSRARLGFQRVRCLLEQAP